MTDHQAGLDKEHGRATARKVDMMKPLKGAPPPPKARVVQKGAPPPQTKVEKLLVQTAASPPVKTAPLIKGSDPLKRYWSQVPPGYGAGYLDEVVRGRGLYWQLYMTPHNQRGVGTKVLVLVGKLYEGVAPVVTGQKLQDVPTADDVDKALGDIANQIEDGYNNEG